MASPEIVASVRRAYALIEAKRPRTIFLAKPPPAVPAQRKTVVGRCAATNLNGTQCCNRSAPGCGGFCKRHMPTKEMLDQL